MSTTRQAADRMGVGASARVDCSVPAGAPTTTRFIPRRIAVPLVLLLLVPYTAYFWASPTGLGSTILGFLPGLIGIGLLLGSGFQTPDLYLRPGHLSRRGGLALAAVFPLLAVIVASGTWSGWDRAHPLESALGGVAQELYFRASVLPAMLWLLRGRLRSALVGHGMLSVAWHARMFTQSGLVLGVVIFLVLLIAQLAWGYAANHDRTVVWVTLQHMAFLVAMSPFTWGY